MSSSPNGMEPKANTHKMRRSRRSSSPNSMGPRANTQKMRRSRRSSSSNGRGPRATNQKMRRSRRSSLPNGRGPRAKGDQGQNRQDLKKSRSPVGLDLPLLHVYSNVCALYIRPRMWQYTLYLLHFSSRIALKNIYVFSM